MILTQLGIFGWKEADENLVLASLLTGDPLLLIGNHVGGTIAFGKPPLCGLARLVQSPFSHINGDDAPEKDRDRPVSARSSLRLGQSRFFPDVEGVGIRLRETLVKAGGHFLRLRNQMPTLAKFLAKFADLLVREKRRLETPRGRFQGLIRHTLPLTGCLERFSHHATVQVSA